MSQDKRFFSKLANFLVGHDAKYRLDVYHLFDDKHEIALRLPVNGLGENEDETLRNIMRCFYEAQISNSEKTKKVE